MVERGEVNFCACLVEQVVAKQGIENKLRYLLKTFLFEIIMRCKHVKSRIYAWR